MKTSRPWILSYDIGGSHASAGLVDASTSDLVTLQSVRVDSSLDERQIIASLSRLGHAAMAAQSRPPVLGIAMSMPGPFDYEKGICYIRGLAKYDRLYGVDFRSAMANCFPEIPAEAVRFVNDAAAALLGEIHAGVARGAERVIGLTLGTGIGSAFAVAGRIVTSGPGIPPGGYIYNLPWKDGMVEDEISSRGIRNAYSRLTGEDRDVRDIAQRAPDDRIAMKVMEDFGRTLGEVLLPLVAGFRPEIVVLGGAIAGSAPLFLPAVVKVLQGIHVDLRPSELGSRSSLIGAAVSWASGR